MWAWQSTGGQNQAAFQLVGFGGRLPACSRGKGQCNGASGSGENWWKERASKNKTSPIWGSMSLHAYCTHVLKANPCYGSTLIAPMRMWRRIPVHSSTSRRRNKSDRAQRWKWMMHVHPKWPNYPTHPNTSVTHACETSSLRESKLCKQTPLTQKDSILHDDRSQFKKRRIPNQKKTKTKQSKSKEEGRSI